MLPGESQADLGEINLARSGEQRAVKIGLGRSDRRGRVHPSCKKEDREMIRFHSGDAGAKAEPARLINVMAVPGGHGQSGDGDKKQYYRRFAQVALEVALPHRRYRCFRADWVRVC